MNPKIIIFNLLFIIIYYTINYTEFYDYHKKNLLFHFHNDSVFYFFNTTKISN
jgi:hypothetical protein